MIFNFKNYKNYIISKDSREKDKEKSNSYFCCHLDVFLWVNYVLIFLGRVKIC